MRTLHALVPLTMVEPSADGHQLKSPSSTCGVRSDVRVQSGRVELRLPHGLAPRERAKSLTLGSRFFVPTPRLNVHYRGEAGGQERCAERVPRAVFAAVPGKTGCKQLGHTFYNLLMPLWDALAQLDWAPNTSTLFLECGGIGVGSAWGGTTLARSPEFIRTAFALLSSRPLRPLPQPLSPKQTTGVLPSLRRQVRQLFGERATCVDELLVGAPCASLDHYNTKLDAHRVRAFHAALSFAVLGRPLDAVWPSDQHDRTAAVRSAVVDRLEPQP
jgi:hypothetical protein